MNRMSILAVGAIITCNLLHAVAGAIDYESFFDAVGAGDVDGVQNFWEENRGMNIDTKNRFGDTSLCTASLCGKEGVAELLLELGANIEAKDRAGNTPLHIASRFGKEGVAKILLEWGANKEAKDDCGRTPLHYASLCGRKGCVELLLNYGADKAAKNNNGRTAAEAAKSLGHDDLAAFIESYQELPEIKEPDEKYN